MTETNYIIDILILLTASVIAVPLFQRFGLSGVLGYLVAGTLVGPWGLGLIVAVDEIRHLAELGIIFLLFIIGIELKPSRLWVMRRSVFGLGTAQVLITGTAITLVALALEMSMRTALVVGFGLALSSTAFALQLLADKSELGTAYGRSAFAILLLQDLAIVPLIALLPLLSTQELSITQDVELAAVESLLIIVGVFILGRIFLQPILKLITRNRRNPEIFTAIAILLVLGASWLTEWAGLSMALGAFLAGLFLADSHYRHQIMADIQPFRGLLLGLFFMSVGMSINFGLLAEKGLLMAVLVSGLLLLKAVLLWVVCRITGRSHSESVHIALLLAQAGEFGFILFGMANMLGVMDDELYQLLLLTIVLSMAATPLLVRLSPWIERIPSSTEPAILPHTRPIPASRNHIIIAGFGRVGNYLARNLEKANIPYLVLESNPLRVSRAQALDYPVFYGDASRIEVLRSAGAANASMVIFAMDHMKSIGQAVVMVREAFPDLPVYARAWDVRMSRMLLSLGSTYVIPETMATSVQLTRDVLRASGISVEATEQIVDESLSREQHKITKHKEANKNTSYKAILLVLTPGIDETSTLDYASVLAEDNQAALTVVEVLTEASSTGVERESSPDELDELMIENRHRRLEKLVARLPVTLEVQTKVLIGKAHEEITREVLSNDHDLVLKVAENGHGLRERIFGNNDSHLLKACPCSVLLIRSIPDRPYRHHRICAGVYQDETPGGYRDDRADINRKILEQAAWLATAQFAELHIVHAWEAYGEQHLQSGRSPLHIDADNYVKREEQRNKEALNTSLFELRESMSSDVLAAFNPEYHLVKGDHRDEIVRLAVNMKADLVVVGDLSHSGVTRFIIESTALAISNQLSCSMLFVKPPDFITPVVSEF